jgi:hypothetical protein
MIQEFHISSFVKGEHIAKPSSNFAQKIQKYLKKRKIMLENQEIPP